MEGCVGAIEATCDVIIWHRKDATFCTKEDTNPGL